METKTNETRITRKIDVEAGTVTFNVPGFPPVVVRLADCAPEVQRYAPLAGINHTVGDAAAMETKTVNGRMHRPTMQEKYESLVERAEQLKTAWKSDREVEDSSILSEALQRITGKSAEEVALFLSGLTKEEKSELPKEKAVGMEMLKVRRDRQFAKLKDAPQNEIAAGLLARLGKKK